MSSDEELIRAHREILANRGIVAYVDVWQDDIMNYSELWQEKLIDMGAKVVKKWNKNVTHLVYKDGRPGIGFYQLSRVVFLTSHPVPTSKRQPNILNSVFQYF